MDTTLFTDSLASSQFHTVVVAVPENGHWPASTTTADEQTQGLIRELKDNGEFNGKLGATAWLPINTASGWKRLLLVGAGKDEERKGVTFPRIVAAAVAKLLETGTREALLALTDLPVLDRDQAWAVKMTARNLQEGLYRFTELKSDEAPALKLTRVAIAGSAGQEDAVAAGTAIGRGMNLARDLGNRPGNICHPSYLAEQAQALGQSGGLQVEILDEDQMRELGMGSLLSVSAGSAQPARLIVMHYRGADDAQPPHVLVGKGITFDTGGISLKPGAGMDEMKYDMGGAASVFGTMAALAEIRPAINVVGVVAAAENMPSGTATRPGDIVTTMSGQTVEILNTDAEGRLVLCDALTYVERFKPASVVDIATLTGACLVALGRQACAVLGNDQALIDQLIASGEQSADRAWQLPLWEEYQSQLDSNFADMQNIGGRDAGTITAACFLARFTKAYPWAHLDVAGTAWNTGKEKGATGKPVPLLMDYLLGRTGSAG